MEKKKKVLQGVVVSNSTDKTGVVLVERLKMHKIYHKRIKSSKKYMFHDEENKVNVGDLVEIIECAPQSKRKKFKLQSILKVAES